MSGSRVKMSRAPYADGQEIYHFETRESVQIQVSCWWGSHFSHSYPGAGAVSCGSCGSGIYINWSALK